MFETKKSATKKLLKDIENAFEGDAMLAQKRKLLGSIEEMAVALKDEGLYIFWNEQSQIVNAQEATLQGRVYIMPTERLQFPWA